MTAPEGAAVHPAARRRFTWRAEAPVVAAVALGGGAGAAARYAASLWWPAQSGGFPWTIFWVNVAGCAVMGAFTVLATQVWPGRRLLRPFFGTGVLGGFTTFSTYAVDIERLVTTGHTGTGLAVLAATPLAALGAVWLAASVTRRALKARHSS
ncbi:CrcB family protein [Streptomyces ziwulingensis]|uniref:Fluoride-specific ion channel FluC n=1 Tax=Streptomyces ziwulingensis TaxID=1045501 RepID=A0ABP9B9A2_9ACTN